MSKRKPKAVKVKVVVKNAKGEVAEKAEGPCKRVKLSEHKTAREIQVLLKG